MVKASNISNLVGVVLLVRHGDRTDYYQDPYTYKGRQGYLTPFGAVQQYELGSFIRSTYLAKDSASYIQGVNSDVVDIDQIAVRADSGGGNVVLDSAYAFLQGLYPPANTSYTLANGTVVVSPLEGYQYIPVESVEYESSPKLTRWMECPSFQSHMARVNKTNQWNHTINESAPFMEAIQPYLNGVDNTFNNMWNIYDYVNVQYTHNKTFYESFPDTLMRQARHYAKDHELFTFSDGTQPESGIGFIAIRTLLPEIFADLTNMAQPDNKLKVVVKELDYKPFVGYAFKLIPREADYNSVAALELIESAGQYSVSMKFKNGTSDNTFKVVKFTGNTTTIPLPDLISSLDWSTVNNTKEWCLACNQTVARGCDVYNL